MLPKFPVSVPFDPEDNPGTAPLWAIPAGRILMLLWRPCHLCSADWFTDALRIAKRIQGKRPQTVEQLVECFRPETRESLDFTMADVKVFAGDALEYFTGRDVIPYTGEVAGEAKMEPVR